MTDPTRSKIMRSIRSKNTSPEVIIRSLLHANGYRFRLHYKKLPGRPDIVLPKYKAAIEVNGCFWHGHDCHLYNPNIKRSPTWKKKICGNKKRDIENSKERQSLGWRTLVIWECAVQGKTKCSLDELLKRIHYWIQDDSLKSDAITGRH